MRLGLLALVIGLGFSSVATASQIESCNQNIDSVVCKNYLEGVVDGALMYRGAAVGQRLETDGYESRALKYRGGKRFQEANREFCRDRIPDRDSLVSGLAEAFSAAEIKNSDDLTTAMFDLMDCQRLK
ncbi:conserved hypothetical protein [Shewanella halifaxensis HAW-EB4]|uniref:Rap1a immunity protein domain-containing protein n=1 Tax=Shewanella halifaxensis (strain HAW-EB4) TaxID=458817 RepID=B0TIU6_SHEHH|nr:hypothetical protein [Shewanella halifaxensis]ABZ75641.1 conserved hypothetical protein [Shewanella halifaxensis HAW-EB4]